MILRALQLLGLGLFAYGGWRIFESHGCACDQTYRAFAGALLGVCLLGIPGDYRLTVVRLGGWLVVLAGAMAFIDLPDSWMKFAAFAGVALGARLAGVGLGGSDGDSASGWSDGGGCDDGGGDGGGCD